MGRAKEKWDIFREKSFGPLEIAKIYRRCDAIFLVFCLRANYLGGSTSNFLDIIWERQQLALGGDIGLAKCLVLARSHKRELSQFFYRLNGRTMPFHHSSQFRWYGGQALQRVSLQPPKIQTPEEVRRRKKGQKRKIDGRSDQTS